MPKVIVEGVAEPMSVERGRRLVLAIEDAGIDILHRCGGNSRCTTCRVEILDGDAGPKTEAEVNRLAREEGLPENIRLSCQVQVNHDLTVRVINRLHLMENMSDSGPRPIEWPADHPLPPQ